MPRPEDRTPRFWLIGGALILAVAIYALWYRHQEALRLGNDLIEAVPARLADLVPRPTRSEEHTSELQSLMRISYALFCLKKKISHIMHDTNNTNSTTKTETRNKH